MYDEQDDRDWLENLKNGETWKRGAFVLLFMLVMWFVRILVVLVAALQFGASLITGRPVARALPFGRSLSFYVRDITLFVTYNSDRRPWPWSPWPEPGGLPEADEFEAEDGEFEAEDGEAGDEAYREAEPPPRRRRAAGPAADETPATEPVGQPKGPGEDDESAEGGAARPRRRKRKAEPEKGDDDPGAEPSDEPPRPDA